MKNVRLLVQKIVEGTLKTKIIAGVVATAVVAGAGVGIYSVVNNDSKESTVPQSLISTTKEQKIADLKGNIEGLLINVNALPEADKSEDIMNRASALKAFDIEADYDNAYEAYSTLLKDYEGIVAKYREEMKKLNDEIQALDKTTLSDENVTKLNDLIQKYTECMGSKDYVNYKSVYEEVMSSYRDMTKDEGETPKGEENNNGDSNQQTPNDIVVNNGSTGNSGSTNSGSTNSGSVNSGSTNSGSVNNGSIGNSGSTNSGSVAQPSTPAPAPAPAPAPSPEPTPEPAPQQPAVPAISSGWKTDISDRIVATLSTVNTNNYGDTLITGYEVMSTEVYNKLYGIAQQVTNGSLSGSEAVSQMNSISFNYFGLPTQVCYSRAAQITVTGCDYDTIYNAISSRIGFGSPDFMYCTVYYDAGTNTSTVTWVSCSVL